MLLSQQLRRADRLIASWERREEDEEKKRKRKKRGGEESGDVCEERGDGGKGCSMYIDYWNIRVCWW